MGFRRSVLGAGLSVLVAASWPAACSSESNQAGPGGGTTTTGSTSSTTSDGGSGGSSTGGAGGSGAGGTAGCPELPSCDAAPPDPGPAAPWNDSLTPILTTSQGSARHRGRDLFLNPGDDQWVLAKFAYGLADKDLKGEDVDIHLLRDCGSAWELLGTATTTTDQSHPTIEGVDDTGGRVFFPIPQDKTLGPGRHRLHLVVKGDLSTAELFIEVVPAGTPIFVSDVDGTLTTYETEEFVDLLTGTVPDANPNAGAALQLLADKGYRPQYLTARPEWLTERTREFVEVRGFPPGLIHTTLSKTGALGSAAVDFKTAELALLAGKGLIPSYGFGNKDSDGQAYANAGIQPADHRIFLQFDDPLGGRRIEDYGELLVEFEALPKLCP
ncbi:MAG: phosphatidylinositol transfer protein [Deltaproteobacteria bacterium]|nr:phosphatidylinositol transfer protein [Deltaproteobacteria bacterium]